MGGQDPPLWGAGRCQYTVSRFLGALGNNNIPVSRLSGAPGNDNIPVSRFFGAPGDDDIPVSRFLGAPKCFSFQSRIPKQASDMGC